MLMNFSSQKGRFQDDLKKYSKKMKDLVKPEKDEQYTQMRSSKHGFIMAFLLFGVQLGKCKAA